MEANLMRAFAHVPRLPVAVVVGGLLVAAALFAAPPAGHAAPPASSTTSTVDSRPLVGPSDCPSTYLCFWVHPGWNGRMGKFSGRNDNWGWYSQPQCAGGTWNDCASAIWNNGRSCEAVVHEHPNQGGANWVINRNTGSDNLAFNGKPTGGNWNDVISSNRWWCG
jgi:hypothetical protein